MGGGGGASIKARRPYSRWRSLKGAEPLCCWSPLILEESIPGDVPRAGDTASLFDRCRCILLLLQRFTVLNMKKKAANISASVFIRVETSGGSDALDSL